MWLVCRVDVVQLVYYYRDDGDGGACVKAFCFWFFDDLKNNEILSEMVAALIQQQQ